LSPKEIVMKKLYTLLFVAILTLSIAACSGGEEEAPTADTPEATTEAVAPVSDLGPEVSKLAGETVEVACGSCIYGMEDVKGCKLAAMIGDEPFLVSGIEFETHSSGLCKEASTGVISGTVHEHGVRATEFELTD
jgi:hypothetical protein